MSLGRPFQVSHYPKLSKVCGSRCLHLVKISARLLRQVASLLWIAMSVFSFRHRLHALSPLQYGFPLLTRLYLTSCAIPLSFSCHTYVDKLVACLFFIRLKSYLCFVYLFLNVVIVCPMYSFTPSLLVTVPL